MEQLDADMNELRQERDNKVTDIQEKTREDLQAQRVEGERKYSDHAVKLEWDEKGNITRESLINLISDLDHDKEVEVQNNSWWNRVFRGQGRQRFAFGESQLKHALRNVSMDQLNALYTRLTGDTKLIQKELIAQAARILVLNLLLFLIGIRLLRFTDFRMRFVIRQTRLRILWL